MELCVTVDTGFSFLNEKVRSCRDRDVTIKGCIGQRYIGAGLDGKNIAIYGTPGNALGAYLNGADIKVFGNAQDATGDTMNAGSIVIYGSSGDATGYAMRGGKIYVRDNAGYRTGIHMKEYRDNKPVIVIGGRAGSFLGEYQAGGVIVVLGKNTDGLPIVNNFCGTGMHGGTVYLRCGALPKNIPEQVSACYERGRDIPELAGIIKDYCGYFDCYDENELLSGTFAVLTPNSQNPYKQMYTFN